MQRHMLCEYTSHNGTKDRHAGSEAKWRLFSSMQAVEVDLILALLLNALQLLLLGLDGFLRPLSLYLSSCPLLC